MLGDVRLGDKDWVLRRATWTVVRRVCDDCNDKSAIAEHDSKWKIPRPPQISLAIGQQETGTAASVRPQTGSGLDTV